MRPTKCRRLVPLVTFRWSMIRCWVKIPHPATTQSRRIERKRVHLVATFWPLGAIRWKKMQRARLMNTWVCKWLTVPGWIANALVQVPLLQRRQVSPWAITLFEWKMSMQSEVINQITRILKLAYTNTISHLYSVFIYLSFGAPTFPLFFVKPHHKLRIVNNILFLPFHSGIVGFSCKIW